MNYSFFIDRVNGNVAIKEIPEIFNMLFIFCFSFADYSVSVFFAQGN